MLQGISLGLKYPERKPFFAHWYTKKLGQLCYANQIGSDGCWLLSQIVMTEDSRRYKSAPTFFNGQLMSIAGCSSENTMVATRKKCINAGLLHYEPGVKRNAGVYWVEVPIFWPAIPDNPLGEFLADAELSPQILRGNQVGNLVGNQVGNLVGNLRPSYPNPIPNPTPTRDAAVVDLEMRLIELGLNRALETITEAMAHGTTLGVLNAVVDYYLSRPGAWEPGGLCRRLTLASAQRLAPDRGWPAADRKRECQEQRRRSEPIREERPKVASTKPGVDPTKAKYRQLELQFGKMLDSISPADQEKLLADNKPIFVKQFRQFGATGFARCALLDIVSTVAECSK